MSPNPILDTLMFCPLCKSICQLGSAIPCAGGGTRYGCPKADCGGILAEATREQIFPRAAGK